MATSPSQPYQPIENYGIIGDLYTAALVGIDGSIDFLAFPHFDSPTIFAALLDAQHGITAVFPGADGFYKSKIKQITNHPLF